MRLEMFKSFLNESRLEKWANEIESFAGLTENFTPKDLRHVAAKIQLKFNLGKGLAFWGWGCHVITTELKPCY